MFGVFTQSMSFVDIDLGNFVFSCAWLLLSERVCDGGAQCAAGVHELGPAARRPAVHPGEPERHQPHARLRISC